MKEIKKGDIVRIREGSQSYNGRRIPDILYSINCYVMSVNGDMITIGIDGQEVATVKILDAILVKS